MASLPGAVASFDGAPAPYKLVQDRKRDLDYRSKYSHGVVIRGEGSKPNQRAIQPAKGPCKIPERKHYYSKTHPRYGIRDKEVLTSGSSTDEEIRESPDSVAPDADIAYSYDAASGPTQGRDIFSMAVNKAVERFETKETEKLVKNEYDVLDRKDFEEEDYGVEGYFGDDDFELIWTSSI